MDKVSLTYFVDFVLKAGSPKVTVVKNFKQRGDYDPQADFYKAARETIVDACKRGTGAKKLAAMLNALSDTKKKKAYVEIVQGWKKYVGRKSAKWFDAPVGDWSTGALTVTVNPEVGLDFGTDRVVAKLYFKEEPLTKNRAEIIAHLMHKVLQTRLKDPTTFAVVDVRRGKAIVPPVPVPGHDALLAGEAASFVAIFQGL